MNVWSFTGNLGRDAEARHLKSGDCVLNLSVGVRAGFGDKQTTVWTKVTVWGKQAEALARLNIKKGLLVGVTGELSESTWTDKDGCERKSIEVRATNVDLLGKRDDAPASSSGHQQRKAPKTPAFDEDEDIPF